MPKRTTRKKRSAQKRTKPPSPTNTSAKDHLLEVAAGILAERGLDTLTQTEVARACGVSQGHLTYYFPKKTDLWLGVARYSLGRVTDQIKEFLAESVWELADKSTKERIVALVQFVVANRRRTQVVLNLAFKAREDPQVRALFMENVERVRSLLAAGMGVALEDPLVDLAHAGLWGLSMQHWLLEGVRDDETTAKLVARFFDTLVVKPR